MRNCGGINVFMNHLQLVKTVLVIKDASGERLNRELGGLYLLEVSHHPIFL
jgi:hypothetical protein